MAIMEKLAFDVHGSTPKNEAEGPTDPAEEAKAEDGTSTPETSSANEEATDEDNESIIEDLEAKLDEKRLVVGLSDEIVQIYSTCTRLCIEIIFRSFVSLIQSHFQSHS